MLKLGTQTGSFFNHLMSNSSLAPTVENGATVLRWSDRSAYFVLSVSADKKQCTIQRADAIRTDNLGMSDCQSYEYKIDPSQPIKELVFRYNAWYERYEAVGFTKAWLKKDEFLTREESKLIFYYDENQNQQMNVVEGYTENKIRYNKINITFSGMNEYYDFSF